MYISTWIFPVFLYGYLFMLGLDGYLDAKDNEYRAKEAAKRRLTEPSA